MSLLDQSQGTQNLSEKLFRMATGKTNNRIRENVRNSVHCFRPKNSSFREKLLPPHIAAAALVFPPVSYRSLLLG